MLEALEVLPVLELLRRKKGGCGSETWCPGAGVGKVPLWPPWYGRDNNDDDAVDSESRVRHEGGLIRGLGDPNVSF